MNSLSKIARTLVIASFCAASALAAAATPTATESLRQVERITTSVGGERTIQRTRSLGAGEAATAGVEAGNIDLAALSETGKIKANQLLVKYKSAARAASAPAMMGTLKIQSSRSLYRPSKALRAMAEQIGRWRLVSFQDGKAAAKAFEALRADPAVEYVVPNARFYLNRTANDLSSQLWGLHNTGQTVEGQAGTADADIDAPEAWDIRTDASNVVVAVIDTGIDYNHPDLAANMWVNPGEIPGNGIDDDGNGYIDDVYGYDFADFDADPIDVQGHGTHVAGTIGAVGNNGKGVVGVAWKTQLMAVKIFGDAESGAYASDIVNGILYAADMGASVSNNSWGSTWGNGMLGELINQPIKEAIEYAADAGMLFVAAAGNASTDLDSAAFNSPSGYMLPNVISVAASDNNDALADFSNYGRTEVDLAAPGVDIYSTLPGGQYGHFSGTSMASPQVAGAAALLLAQYPGLTPAELRSTLMGSVDRIAGLDGKVASGGRLNLHRALTALDTAGACTVHTATAAQHISAGRAVACGLYSMYACAKGSNENLGSRYLTTQIGVIETAPGYFVKGSTCPGGGVDYPPVISLQGARDHYLMVGGSYTLGGYTASDREDGDLTAQVLVQDNVDVSTPGSYWVSYSVIDSEGKPAGSAHRAVHVTAEDPPPTLFLLGPVVNFMYGELTVNEQGKPFEEPGYIAFDHIEGDLSDQVTRTPLDTSYKNLQWLYYDVQDSIGQHAAVNGARLVAVLDRELPHVFFINGIYLDYQIEPRDHVRTWLRQPGKQYSIDYYPNAFAADFKDSVLEVSEDNPVDLTVEGSYQVTVTATDSDGNSYTGVQTVEVVRDVTPPVVTLIGPAQQQLEIGSRLENPWNTFTYSDDFADDTNSICYVSVGKQPQFLDYLDQEGSYTVTYTVRDCSENETQKVRTIEVVRSHWDHAPRLQPGNIKVNGNYPRQLRVSGTVVDVDGDLQKVELSFFSATDGVWSPWVEASGTASFSYTFSGEPGWYYVKARATDANGNSSGEVISGGEGWIDSYLIRPHAPVIHSASASVSGGEVTIFGSASDGDGDLQEVYVVEGGQRIATCSGTESFTCKLSGRPVGTQTVYLYGRDATDLVGTRLPVTFTITATSCHTATNSAHAAAGRATLQYSVLYYAVGSNDYLGLSGDTTTLQQQGTGWKKVTACP